MEIIERNRTRELEVMTRFARSMLDKGMRPSEVEVRTGRLVRHYREATERNAITYTEDGQVECLPIFTYQKEVRSVLRPNSLVPVYGPRRVFVREERVDPWAIIADHQDPSSDHVISIDEVKRLRTDLRKNSLAVIILGSIGFGILNEIRLRYAPSVDQNAVMALAVIGFTVYSSLKYTPRKLELSKLEENLGLPSPPF